MRRTTLLLLAALAAGCTLQYNPIYRFNEVQVVNLSGGSIENVSWRVLGSDKSLSCSKVARFAMCADFFPPRRYPHAGIQVDWTHPDGAGKSVLLDPHIPAYFPNAFPLRIVMEIEADGEVKGFYEQDEPSREGGGLYVN